MYSVTLENEYGKLNFDMYSPYTIDVIEGLSPPNTNINLSQMALLDGKMYNSAKSNERVIELAFAIEYDVEFYRLQAYRILRVKKPIRFTYKSDLRNVFIDGYIGNVDVGHFDNKQIVTVEIVCPNPFFKETAEDIQELWNVVKNFHFPFAITETNPIPLGWIEFNSDVTVENNGDVDTGIIIKFIAKGTISNPKVVNYDTSEYFGLNTTLQSGDEVTINTNAGYKTVKLTRNGNEINLFNTIMDGSTWLQLDQFKNIFVYEVESGDWSNLVTTFSHFDLYEGV